MNLTAMRSLGSARRKFFMNSTYIMSRKQESNVFRRTSYLESRNQTFWAKEAEMSSGGRNESNSHQLARIGERKIFHELDVHHVQKVGIERFWAQEAQRSLTANSSFESARRKFFMNSTYIMSRKQESNIFRRTSCLESRNQTFLAQAAEMSLTAISSLEQAKEKFFINSTYIMSRQQQSNVFLLRRPK